MSNKTTDPLFPREGFKNESTRQRWDLFHRAIAHAKQSNVSSLQAENGVEEDTPPRATLQSVAR